MKRIHLEFSQTHATKTRAVKTNHQALYPVKQCFYEILLLLSSVRNSTLTSPEAIAAKARRVSVLMTVIVKIKSGYVSGQLRSRWNLQCEKSQMDCPILFWSKALR